jgi:hypothetical protein
MGSTSFPQKRDALKASNLKLNRDVGAKNEWTIDQVNERSDLLATMALKVFVP